LEFGGILSINYRDNLVAYLNSNYLCRVKKLFTFLLIVIYSVSSIGATISTHFCAGKVRACKCAKSKKKDSCCTKTTVYHKSQDNHEQVKVANNSTTKWIISQNFTNQPFVALYNKVVINEWPIMASPPPISRRIYLLDGVFRI
jgi:hypothetical protein